jgi:hypothetical protein
MKRGPKPIPPAIRFWRFVEKTKTCWLWCGGIAGRGYGYFATPPLRHVYAHRFSYELAHGEIPDGLTIDHLCRNKLCVNPAHLEAITNQENNRRGNSATALNSRKTHCPLGHPLFGDNLQPAALRKGKRECRICCNAQANARYYRLYTAGTAKD